MKNMKNERLRHATEELRQHVIDLTMLPVATVFDAFPRAVRDLARSFGKQVELRMSGTGPFYESLESCGARIATYLQGRGAGRVAAQATSETR